MSQLSDWAAFYEATSGHQPFQTLVKAMALFAAEKDKGTESFAVDLGCGAGRDTFALLTGGWRVLAIDQQPEAIERIQAGVPSGQKARLQTQVAAFEEVVLPPADLVNATFSLPFCAPQHFARFWNQIITSIRPGGRFAGQFFGERDSWAGNTGMTFHTRAQIDRLLDGFEVELFKEIAEDGQTAVGASKYWHVFHIIACKQGSTLCPSG
ncbi:MAG: class I SAM-dependent methyltransferase [Chloroflexi bacterium]|nr:class I SAM-dependent methyltransferase [Chloroflexota bacterium]